MKEFHWLRSDGGESAVHVRTLPLSCRPVASLVGMAAREGIPVVIVNNTATPYDEVAAALVRDPIGKTLPRLLALGDVTASDS